MIKYHGTKFEDYVVASENNDLHDNNEILNDDKLKYYDLNTNLILYGPPGIGKYTQALKIIKKFSASGLKYERKINIETAKNKIYFIKISDIHYEVDMELLGCNAKILWNELFKSILDIISTKQNHTGIILCKNFHTIHNELLDIFYSYMQSLNYKNIKISFILLTEHISFIPNNILNKSFILPINRPNKSRYKSTLGVKNNYNRDIFNIKAVQGNNKLIDPNKIIVTKLIKFIKDKRMIDLDIRNTLYNILIYQLDIYTCVWDIIVSLIKDETIVETSKLQDITDLLYDFLKLYNNNYRPIYHLERFFLNLIIIIHDI
jgi:hypothetical protein